jgi:hypothetical protein
MSNSARVDSVRRPALAMFNAVLVVGLAVGDLPIGGGDRTGAVDPGQISEPFTIAGDAAEPNSPGVMVPLDLEFMNPHDAALSVTDLSVTVRDVSAPNADNLHPCTAGDFAVAQVSSSLAITVAGRATSTLTSLGVPRASWPQVAMIDRPVNQDGCKGASLALAYTASGTLER